MPTKEKRGFFSRDSIVEKEFLPYNQVPSPQLNNATMKPKKPVDFAFDPLLFDNENFNHAEFLQKQGELSLIQGDLQGIHYFDLAAQIDDDNARLLYEQGLSLFEYGSEQKKKKYLLSANKKFKLATKLDHGFFEAWYAWANTLFFLGRTFSQQHFFINAKEKFQKAIDLIDKDSSDWTEIHWDFALLMRAISRHSGEISDMQICLNSFANAAQQEKDLPAEFWQDYGEVCISLGEQINDSRLLIEAIGILRKAINKNNSSSSVWADLASALARLYETTYDEDHFSQSNACFANATNMFPQSGKVWLAWASLLKDSGKRTGDLKRLHSAIEKCQRSFSYNYDVAEGAIVWSDALISLGARIEKISLIQEGGNKIIEAIDKFGNTPQLAEAHGIYLAVLGSYYDELDYYYQAIEKFQEGLSIDRTYHTLWYQLGHTYAIAAEIEDDPSIYERAMRFFTKAIYFYPTSTYYFEYAHSLAKLASSQQDAKCMESAILHFRHAFSLRKNSLHLNPTWLYQYATALDAMGDLVEEDSYYEKAIEVLNYVSLLDPEYRDVHFKLALFYTHLGESSQVDEHFVRGLHHYKIAHQRDEENDQILLDWGLSLMNLADLKPSEQEKHSLFQEAEFKLVQAAKLGNTSAYYHLACLFSIQNAFDQSFFFLKKAQQFDGLPPIDDLFQDLWLENLRNTDIFRNFLDCFESNPHSFPED